MPQDDKKNTEGVPLRTIILFLVFVPVILWLMHFGYRKSVESAPKAEECRSMCVEQGYAGHDFKWGFFSGPQCECLQE